METERLLTDIDLTIARDVLKWRRVDSAERLDHNERYYVAHDGTVYGRIGGRVRQFQPTEKLADATLVLEYLGNKFGCFPAVVKSMGGWVFMANFNLKEQPTFARAICDYAEKLMQELNGLPLEG